MSKRKILMSLATLCVLSTAAMADGPKAGGVINAVIQPEPPSLMVGLVQNGPTQMVAGNIYEGLLRYSSKLDPCPASPKAGRSARTARSTRSSSSRA
jgi:peptide/nickel transport system substrate-binding protein